MKHKFQVMKIAFCTTFILMSAACSFDAPDDPGRVVDNTTKETIPLSLPRGVTRVDMMEEQSSSQARFLGTRLGTETGDPLFVPDVDDLSVWSCAQQCAERYEPFLAPPDAETFGAWSLGNTEGKQNQWMYHGKPLFMGVVSPDPGEEEPGSSSSEDSKSHENATEASDGLTLAWYGLAGYLQRPPTISVEDLEVAGGQALVTTDRRTIYFYMGDAAVDQIECGRAFCFASWKAVEAPMLAQSIGEFIPVAQANGVVQWTYSGKPLYTFRGDFAPGQAKGANQSEHWKVAQLTRDYRPPDVLVAEIAGQGYFLSTSEGKPLYNRLPFRHRFGGRNSFEGYIHNLYEDGKKLGTDGCDAECLKTWEPFLAPAGAQPTGYWEVFERPDGTRQWAYQGYALYTNVLDMGPENTTDTKLYEPLIGTNARYDLADGVAHNGPGKAAGLNWHLAKP